VLIVGLWIINRVIRLMGAGMERSNTEPTLAKFLCNLSSVGLKALLLISVASMVGIETTSFIAVLGAAGLAVGLALQGSLSNFAGGVLVLMFRPYKVGDFIDAQGVMGTVHEIQIFNTILKTPDNKVIIVPNGSISNGIITNFSMEATRRVDFVFGIGYSDDIGKAKSVIEGLVKADERALADPEPQIVVSELADSSVNITTRVWVNAADYWGLFFDLTEKVKLAFDQEGISIPFPQRDLHVFQENG
jgi:small conductance mechanosensitive channel